METQFANIEGECLLVYFSLENFHTYIYGWHITVQNNCKPLKMIQHKPIHATPPQLQHMLLWMQKYDYVIAYRPGKDMMLGNCMSHFPSY